MALFVFDRDGTLLSTQWYPEITKENLLDKSIIFQTVEEILARPLCSGIERELVRLKKAGHRLALSTDGTPESALFFVKQHSELQPLFTDASSSKLHLRTWGW